MSRRPASRRPSEPASRRPSHGRADPPALAQRPVSLADVASLAGVSSGTASRAMSRPEMISGLTRDRVLAAADRLGYVANGAARALALRRTRTVGAIVPRFGTSSFATMIQSLESTLADARYTLLLSAPEHRAVREPVILRTLLERGVDAVALLGAEQSPRTFALLAAHRTPFVMLWALHSEHGPCIGFDEREAAALVVDHLAALGHRSVGFIGGTTKDNERARRRFRGMIEALVRHGMTLCPEASVETEYGFREGFEAMKLILARRAPITAIVCGNDYLATGALSALHGAGVPVPDRLSIASFNDNDFAAYLHPALTTVRLPIGAIGVEAGRRLVAMLEGDPGPRSTSLPVELVVRASTSPIRTA